MSGGNKIEMRLSNAYAERDRRHRQEEGVCFEILETLFVAKPNTSIYRFGSAVEGTEILNSDMDVVHCYDGVTVVENLKDVPNRAFINILCSVVMMVDCDASPGYVKLQVVANGRPLTNKCPEGEFLQYGSGLDLDSDGRIVLCKVIDEQQIFLKNMTKTGPAVTVKDENMFNKSFTVDHVFAVRYQFWPDIATEWLSRKREHDWPPKATIERLKKLGCFLVHVGSPGSKEMDLEWRISFSLQERELMFGLNNVQHTCYMLLKFITKNFLNDKENQAISSYHCKTSLFCMIERNSQSIWVMKNLTDCVLGCLKILQEWVLQRSCPNYFVVTENMFARIKEEKLFLNVSKKLQSILDKDDRIVPIFEIYQLGDVLKNPLCLASDQLESVYWSQLAHVFKTLAISVKILINALKLDNKCNDFDYTSKDFILETINVLKKHLYALQTTKAVNVHTEEEYTIAIDLLIPFIHTGLGSHYAAYSLQCKNASENAENKKLAEKHLKLGVSSDFASGKLKKVLFQYINKEYDICLDQLTSLAKDYKIHVRNVSCLLFSETDANKKENVHVHVVPFLETKDFSIKEFARQICSACILFSPTEVDLMPSAIQTELFRTFTCAQKSEFFCNHVFIDSQMFMYFLWYLISQKMRKTRSERLIIIQKMKDVLTKLNHVATALNLISWALAEEMCIKEAMEYLVMSWNHKLKKKNFIYQKYFFGDYTVNNDVYGKSVPWHMLILLWRIWFTDFIPRTETLYGISFCFNCLTCLQQNIDTIQKCSKCKIARYCSKDCQKRNCKVHRYICKMFSAGLE